MKYIVLFIGLLAFGAVWLYFYTPPLRMASPGFTEQYGILEIEKAVMDKYGYSLKEISAGEKHYAIGSSSSDLAVRLNPRKLFPKHGYFEKVVYGAASGNFSVCVELSNSAAVQRIYLTSDAESMKVAEHWSSLFKSRYPLAPLETAITPDKSEEELEI